LCNDSKTASVFTAPSVVSGSSFQKCTASVSRSWSSLELGLADTGIGFWYSPLRQRRPREQSGAVFNSGAKGQGAAEEAIFLYDGVRPSTHRQRSTMGTCTLSAGDTERPFDNASVVARGGVSREGIPPHLPGFGEQHQRYPGYNRPRQR
jgi:hypothetical protein